MLPTEIDGDRREKTPHKSGGGIAKKARLELESKTGKKVVATQNYLSQDNHRRK